MKFFKVFDYMDKLIELFIIFATGLLVVICFLAVVFRFFLGNSLFWADEFMRYLFVVATMLGSALLIIKKGHIMIDFTQLMFGPKTRRVVAFICYLAITIFGTYMMIDSIQLVKMGADQVSSAMAINMAYIYISFPIGFGMTAINGIRLIADEFFLNKNNGEG